jgi:hypothetical protein
MRSTLFGSERQQEGRGIISLMNGGVSGRDNISSYTGTYVQQGDKIYGNSFSQAAYAKVAFRVRNGQSHHTVP